MAVNVRINAYRMYALDPDMYIHWTNQSEASTLPQTVSFCTENSYSKRYVTKVNANSITEENRPRNYRKACFLIYVMMHHDL